MIQPNLKLTRLVDAAVEPVTLDDAKRFARVEITDDDDMIAGFITAARLECERINSRSYIRTSWRMTLDYFPPYSARVASLLTPAILGPTGERDHWRSLADTAIEFPRPPLISVDAIRYLDQAGVLQTLDPAGPAVRIGLGTPGQMTPAYGSIFPFTLPTLGAVEIDFTAGYGPDATFVPKTVATAIRFLASHYYEHRTATADVPPVVASLLSTTWWGA